MWCSLHQICAVTADTVHWLVEVFGKITIAAVSIPVVSMLLETVEKCVGY